MEILKNKSKTLVPKPGSLPITHPRYIRIMYQYSSGSWLIQ
jgi:hypothetical protein